MAKKEMEIEALPLFFQAIKKNCCPFRSSPKSVDRVGWKLLDVCSRGSYGPLPSSHFSHSKIKTPSSAFCVGLRACATRSPAVHNISKTHRHMDPFSSMRRPLFFPSLDMLFRLSVNCCFIKTISQLFTR